MAPTDVFQIDTTNNNNNRSKNINKNNIKQQKIRISKYPKQSQCQSCNVTKHRFMLRKSPPNTNKSPPRSNEDSLCEQESEHIVCSLSVPETLQITQCWQWTGELTVWSDYTALWKRPDSRLEFCCAGDICIKNTKLIIPDNTRIPGNLIQANKHKCGFQREAKNKNRPKQFKRRKPKRHVREEYSDHVHVTNSQFL